MPLENAEFISELDPTSPTGGEGVNQGDDHIRVTKKATQQSFENISGPVTATHDDLNLMTGAATGGSPLCVTGMIIAYMAPNAPDGWLLCDGALIAPEFVDLILMVGANTPNLNGQFLRGMSIDAAVDPDGPRAPGTTQADQFKSHLHGTTYYDDQNLGGTRPGLGQGALFSVQNSELAGGDETRPKNVAVNYIIKT